MRGMILALALGAVPLASAADAATLSFTGSRDGIGTFSLNQFNPSLGRLQSARFDYFGEAGDSEAALGDENTGATATAFAQVGLTFAGLTFQGSDYRSSTCTALDESECFTEAIARAFIEDSLLLDLALLSGTGVMGLSLFGNGNLGVRANATITYTYSPVPLPAGGGLMIAGLGGLAALRRRRAVKFH